MNWQEIWATAKEFHSEYSIVIKIFLVVIGIGINGANKLIDLADKLLTFLHKWGYIKHKKHV